jgi:Transglutaminase-like superfamily
MLEAHEPFSEKWRRFRKRPQDERALILRAMVLLPLTEFGLRWFGFRRWKELIEEFSLSARGLRVLPLALQQEMAGRAVGAMRSVELHGPVTPNCLERSMTLWWILRREGVEGELHIGARKEDGAFKAHAWVELGGEILNDSANVHNHYARFDAPIAAADGGSGDTNESEAHTVGNNMKTQR